MSKQDGNKLRRRQIKKMARTMENYTENARFLEEHANELTPNQIQELRHTQMKKLKYLKEVKGTIKNNGAVQ